jgi:hypothetical protein
MRGIRMGLRADLAAATAWSSGREAHAPTPPVFGRDGQGVPNEVGAVCSSGGCFSEHARRRRRCSSARHAEPRRYALPLRPRQHDHLRALGPRREEACSLCFVRTRRSTASIRSGSGAHRLFSAAVAIDFLDDGTDPTTTLLGQLVRAIISFLAASARASRYSAESARWTPLALF